MSLSRTSSKRLIEMKAIVKAFKTEIESMESNALYDLRNQLHRERQIVSDQLHIIGTKHGIITGELKRRDQPGPTVDISEHAVLRYLERIQGIDMSAIRKKIRAAIPPDAKRGETFEVDGMSYIISESGRVLTLYQNGDPS